MSELAKRIGPPESQSLVLRLDWELWIAIRDSGRVHQRTTSQEIRAAIEYWLRMHAAEQEYSEHASRIAHEDQR